MRILGIDPGTIRMGFGVLEEREEVAALCQGVIAPDKATPLEERLHRFYTALVGLIEEWCPDEVAVEEPFVGRNVRSAFAIGQAEAVALIAAATHSLPVFRYSPAQVKQAVADYGGASKERVQELLRLILRLPEPPPSDAANALAVALCRLRQRQLEAVLGREIRPGG